MLWNVDNQPRSKYNMEKADCDSVQTQFVLKINALRETFITELNGIRK